MLKPSGMKKIQGNAGSTLLRNINLNQPKIMSQKFQEIIDSERPVLIDFFATWCQPCKVQSSVLNTVKENVGDKARIIKVDVDQYPAIASQYGVRGVPTLAVFKKGELLYKESGVHDVNRLTQILEQYI